MPAHGFLPHNPGFFGRALTLLLAVLPATALAQGLPPYRAINPLVTARTGLGFVPVQDLSRRWSSDVILDYASVVEVASEPDAEFVLDSEIMRLRATVSRRVGRRSFIQASAGLGGAYDGFLDKVLDAYHDLIGLREGNRSQRPDNVFAYYLRLPDGSEVVRQPTGGFVGDLRLTGGWLVTRHLQIAASVTLPTTGPDGYGADAVATALSASARSRLIGDRLVFEGGAGIGYTPRAGDLREWQRTFFTAVNGGLRLRFWGRQSAFANIFHHSPVYERTTLPELDRNELSIDVGFLFQPGGGPEILAALTEDLQPGGPAVDVVFRLGARW